MWSKDDEVVVGERQKSLMTGSTSRSLTLLLLSSIMS